METTSKPNHLHLCFVLVLVLVLLTGTASAADILVHTVNQLGGGRVLNVHCTLDLSTDEGAHDIASGDSYEWKFGQDKDNGFLLECDASTKGASNVLHFAGYHRTSDVCTSNCDWRFTDKGVLHLVDGQWTFYNSWPN